MNNSRTPGMFVRLAAFAALVGLAAMSVQCRGKPRESKAGQSGGAGNAAPAVEKVVLIEILEENTDTFGEPLFISSHSQQAPFRRIAGGVVLAKEIADQTDAAALEACGLRLGDAKVPLSRCGVLVVHVIRYRGVGRDDTQVRFYGFKELPASIPLPAAPAGDAFEYDPAARGVPFSIAIDNIRIFGDAPGEIAIRKAKDDKIVVTLAETAKGLAAGESVELANNTRTIHVTQKALTRDAIEWRGTRPANLPLNIRPPQDHGRIKFATKLTVTYLGVHPVVEDKQPQEQELLQ